MQLSFNPCCDGSCFGISGMRCWVSWFQGVSILVVMEVALEFTLRRS